MGLSTLLPDLVRGWLYLVYPKTCWMCGRLLDLTEADFCPPCRTFLTSDAQASCPRCSGTVGPYSATVEGCAACRDQELGFDRSLRLGTYEGPLRDLVLRMKHVAEEGLAEAVGRLWAKHCADRLQTLAVSVIIPVPLHWTQHVARGYNQSEALARPLARELKIPCRPSWLRRIRRTQRQTQQPNATARRNNVKGAFSTRSSARLQGQRVLLVDDVMTTGATAGEAARAVRKGGADFIVAAVLAHAR